MSDEECAPITAVEGFDLSGNHYFLIGVQPNKEDLEALNRGEPIYIKVTGDGFAPIAIWTMNENCEPND